MIGALMGLLVAGVVGLVVLVALLAVVGLVFGVVGLMVALAVKLIPLLLIGWVVVKLIQKTDHPRYRISAADQPWLDGWD